MTKQNEEWFGQTVPSVELGCVFTHHVPSSWHRKERGGHGKWVFVQYMNELGQAAILLFAHIP